jgi:hypothetical protein
MSELVIAASGSATTEAINLVGYEDTCVCFLQLSGSGTASLIYELSLDNVNWSQVATYSSLVTGFLVTSGPASDGKDYLYFNPPAAAWLRFKISETGTSNSIIVTLIAGVC